ncbi:MAG TPA: Spy/CpxP family protein refolding chaperone [Longimicrobiaceae bacterium]|nr:Spy/CpxP family protein refolding chaperone [Longimicrobiaceae bacterium]
MRFQFGAALVALTFAATAAPAQGHQPHAGQGGGGGMMGMMQGGGMDAMPGPEMVLRLRDALALSDDQVRRIEEIQLRTHSEHHQRMQAGMHPSQAAAAILQGNSPDLEEYEDLLEQAAEHDVAASVALARGMVDTRAVLTADQLAKLDVGIGMMHEMMRGPGMGGGGHGGGRHGAGGGAGVGSGGGHGAGGGAH